MIDFTQKYKTVYFEFVQYYVFDNFTMKTANLLFIIHKPHYSILAQTPIKEYI